jgi:hypothetical protein
MPAFRIVYLRSEASSPETIVAGFESLDHAMAVFAARGLRILYIAERAPNRCRPEGTAGESVRKGESRAPSRSSFPIRRYSARALA